MMAAWSNARGRIARGAGIHAQHTDQAHVQTGFLAHFPAGRLFRLFSFVDEATGQGVAQRGAAPPYQHDAPRGVMDDDIRCGRRVGELGKALAAMRTVKCFFHAQQGTPLVFWPQAEAFGETFILF